MNKKKKKNRFNYLVKMIKNDIAEAKAEDVIEGQTTIEDYLDDEDMHVAEFNQDELSRLVEDLKKGRL